jgi:hypothetical protein
MPDNVGYTPGVGTKVASRDVTYSGEAAQLQVLALATVAGGDDAKTVKDVSVDNPLPTAAPRVEDVLVMLSRVVKLLESNAVVDQQQRQRISLDAIAAGLTLGTVTTVGTVTNVSTVAAQTAMAGMDREMYINTAKQTYANSIRPQLQFI